MRIRKKLTTFREANTSILQLEWVALSAFSHADFSVSAAVGPAFVRGYSLLQDNFSMESEWNTPRQLSIFSLRCILLCKWLKSYQVSGSVQSGSANPARFGRKQR